MGITTKTYQNKYITATGSNGVLTQLMLNAYKSIRGKKLTEAEADETITERIREYQRAWNWIQNKPTNDQLKFHHIIKRIRSVAINFMAKNHRANKFQMDELKIIDSEVLFIIAFRKELADYIELELDDTLPFKNLIRDIAKGGHRVNYCTLNDLTSEYESIKEKKALLISGCLKTRVVREKYNERGEEIQYDIIEELPKKSPQVIILTEYIELLLDLKKQIIAEIRKKSKERSELKNLCYYLLYDESYTEKENAVIPYQTEDEKHFINRIRKLSITNLINMIKLLCGLNNEYYKNEILKQRKSKKKLNRRKKNISSKDKLELIQMGKNEMLTQEEVAKQLNCSLSTVKRNWNT